MTFVRQVKVVLFTGQKSCTAVVVSMSILPYIEKWLDTFCQGVQLPLLAFLVSS